VNKRQLRERMLVRRVAKLRQRGEHGEAAMIAARLFYEFGRVV
jgi:hypothetical protein